jgi:hypothetical protein
MGDVVAGHTPAKCDATGGIADWRMSMTVTTEFDDVVV